LVGIADKQILAETICKGPLRTPSPKHQSFSLQFERLERNYPDINGSLDLEPLDANEDVAFVPLVFTIIIAILHS